MMQDIHCLLYGIFDFHNDASNINRSDLFLLEDPISMLEAIHFIIRFGGDFPDFTQGG